MQATILHDGALTVELESNGTVTLKVAGCCPTLDDIARQRAQDAYMSEEDAINAPGSTPEYKEALGGPWPTWAYEVGK